MKLTRLLLLFFLSLTSYAQTDVTTLPPGTVLQFEDVVFDRFDYGVSYHYGINDIEGVDNWYWEGFPVSYGVVPAHNTYPNIENIDTWKYAGWYRDFYPSLENIWRPGDGVAPATMASLLKEADSLHLAKLDDGTPHPMKLLWTPANGYPHSGETTTPWGNTNILTPEFEQEYIDCITDLLTSDITSGLGFTFAEHPAIAAFELFNERVRFTTARDYADVYARTLRIVTKLFEQYKPDCEIISFCVQGGEGNNLITMFNASAESIITPKVATNGDDGTGKVAADYMQTHSHHFYQEGLETKATYDAWTANNDFSSLVTYYLHLDHALTPFWEEANFNPSSPFYQTDISQIPIWNTESGTNPEENVHYRDGGFRTFLLDEDESLHAQLKWFVPIHFYLRDGQGGPGVNFQYKSDLPGIGYNDGTIGSAGTISNVVAGDNGRIRLTLSEKPGNSPANFWVDNMRICITAPSGGWSDLGLSAGEKEIFATKLVDNASNTVELKKTTFTQAPSGTLNYTEFQTSHSFGPKSWKRMYEIMTAGPASFGWIPYDDGSLGVCIVTAQDGIFYTLPNGDMRKWVNKQNPN